MTDKELFGNSEQLEEKDHIADPGKMVGDSVSRQSAIDALNEYFARIGKLKRRGLSNAEKAISLDTVGAIKTLPSAQPEIVACGDCIHWICHDRRCGYWNHGVKPLDWCCHAERRTDG